MLNLLAGMASGTDPFTQRPLDPQGPIHDLPWQYHADPRTPKVTRLLAQTLAKLNIPIPDQLGEKLLAPSRLDFVTRALGGTAAQTIVGYGGDQVIGKLMEMGVIPPDTFKPTTWEDMRLPPNVSQARRERVLYALDQLNSQDNRPWWAKLPTVLRVGGGGSAIVHDFHQRRQGETDNAFQGANRDYAIKDPMARMDLAAKIPGPPIHPWQDQITKLPEGVSAEISATA
jgi:hypothetical protein